jgi:hypothetical protein
VTAEGGPGQVPGGSAPVAALELQAARIQHPVDPGPRSATMPSSARATSPRRSGGRVTAPPQVPVLPASGL